MAENATAAMTANMVTLLASVNLGLLQTVRVIHIHRLPLGIEINGAGAAFAMSVAGGFGAAEGKMDFGADRRRIDVSDAGVQVAHGAVGLVDIAGIERRREAVDDAVGNLDGLVEAAAGDHAHHRAKDFFLRDPHFGVDVGKDGRLMEPATGMGGALEALTAAQQVRAFVAADLDVFFRCLHLSLIDLGAHGSGFVEPVADREGAGAVHKFIEELLVNTFLHNDTAGGSAPLAAGAEAAPERSLYGEIEVGVVEHDDGVLAAHLQRAVLETARGSFADQFADFARTGEGNGTDVRMAIQWAADFGAVSGDDVDDAAGRAGFPPRADKVKR